MANPNYAMCVVTSFRTTDLRTWYREQQGKPSDILTVQPDVPQRQIDLTGGWPPHVATPDSDATAMDIVARTDTARGGVVHTEVATRNAGDSASAMTFISGLRTADGRFLIASGQAASAGTLDTLLLMVRTIARSQAPDPNRR